MKKKMIVGIVIVAIVALTGIGLYLKDKGKQKLDTYSESVGTQTDANAKEIVDGNGAHFFEVGKEIESSLYIYHLDIHVIRQMNPYIIGRVTWKCSSHRRK